MATTPRKSIENELRLALPAAEVEGEEEEEEMAEVEVELVLATHSPRHTLNAPGATSWYPGAAVVPVAQLGLAREGEGEVDGRRAHPPVTHRVAVLDRG
eukprot:CAMPEP_0196737324 /NCGR_PEP_ID=MMETSP1091-20130531/15096_1 /TAXON_ID=302021 /ORGANISM="Rhodomonas sp., Strain CCMP768" /LENGTH=98 /DNA_ID=CAMNT_0042081159 /DNA_START=69 /DNA_END=360 /DNA_ORIENTATION=+